MNSSLADSATAPRVQNTNPLLHSLRRVRGRLRTQAALWRLHRQWDDLATQQGVVAIHRPPRRLLILPAEPSTLTGSRGDEAMMQGVVHYLRQQGGAQEVSVITASPQASAAARSMGFEALQLWNGSLATIMDAIAAFAPDAVVVVGADVMDGYYGATTPTQLLAVSDLLTRRGVATAVLGFSFNESPRSAMRSAFNKVCSALTLNVRDPVSHERFQRFSTSPANLVADAAFLLQPAEDASEVQRTAEWAKQRRAAGDTIIGFNVHPMLIKNATPAQLDAIVDAAVTALSNIAARRPISWLLVSHDFRALGDDACLAPIEARLVESLAREKVFRVAGEPSSTQLKAIAGLADGVVTGRMHLAIASLGMGVPVVGVTYQGKFEGLFKHFDLPSWLLLSPEQTLQPGLIEQTLDRFIDELPSLRASVASHWPAVLAASQRNLASLL